MQAGSLPQLGKCLPNIRLTDSFSPDGILCDVGPNGQISCAMLTLWSAPSGWTESSRRFDRLPGVLILELHGAEIAKGRVQPS